MAASSAQARNSGRITSAVARGLRESAIIAMGVIALVTLAALVTFNEHDPGFAVSTDSKVVHNEIGPLGAFLSSFLLFVFGRPAYLFPVMVGLACWFLFRREKAGRR